MGDVQCLDYYVYLKDNTVSFARWNSDTLLVRHLVGETCVFKGQRRVSLGRRHTLFHFLHRMESKKVLLFSFFFVFSFLQSGPQGQQMAPLGVAVPD